MSVDSARNVDRERVVILGSTGSIGDSTLDVIARHSDRFRVLALSCRNRLDKLFDQCRRFEPDYAVVDDPAAAGPIQDRLQDAGIPTRVMHGRQGLVFIAGHADADVVVTGIVGAAGLAPTIAAVGSCRRVLVANKEPLVMMGRVILQLANDHGATIIPLDSEHNAIFQCLPAPTGNRPENLRPKGVRRILLTASGGPLRTMPLEQLARVTPEQAIAHPNWSMGPKISVDSASMMNKGLELIEACALFGLVPDDVRVVIHPQSMIHSMVEYIDGSVIAQMGAPDMRIPIAHGLGWPERIESGAANLDFFTMNQLEFEEPDEVRFPCLGLARRAAEAGGTVPAILNAANEVAVDAFLSRRLSFSAIPAVIEEALSRIAGSADQGLESVLAADSESRHAARRYIDFDIPDRLRVPA